LKCLQEAGFALLQKIIQYCSVSEWPRTTFKSGISHMHNQEWKDKASVNILVMCRIRCTVKRVDLLDIKYVEVIIHMPVIHIAW